jgi:hypothetical protein
VDFFSTPPIRHNVEVLSTAETLHLSVQSVTSVRRCDGVQFGAAEIGLPQMAVAVELHKV